MKFDAKDEIPNGTPKILIPSHGVLNKDGVSKSGNKLERHCCIFMKLDRKIYHVKYNLEISYLDDTIEGAL